MFPDRSIQVADVPRIHAEIAQAAQEAVQKTLEAQAVQTTPEPIKVFTQPPDMSSAKMFIYMHESGNNPSSVNASGCRGLGQACPGSKLPCGDDYTCQDAYFTNYMLGRYGSWENARAFWLANSWW